ncbi:MAG TPA: lipid-binding SYLF domain-containing protein [Opitutaceae bacterium]|jgi:lipid-binding SYLF domain-containing protein
MKAKFVFTLLLASVIGTVAARAADERADAVTQVESCEAILRQFMAVPADAIPSQVLHAARGILITNQFKAGFIFGVKGGYGVLMVRQASGHWSLPVIVRADEASLGFQAGAKSVETVYIFTNDQTPHLLFRQRFDIGVDAKAVAGPHTAEYERFNKPLLYAPVLVYSKSSGLFAGATFKAAQIARDDKANFILYHTSYEMPELLYSDWVQPPDEVKPLMAFVQQITQ